MLRSLLALEEVPTAEFAEAVCSLVGADHFLLFAPRTSEGYRLVLNTPMHPSVTLSIQEMEWDPVEVTGLFPSCGGLRMTDGTALPSALSECFPAVRWVLSAVGDSWSCCALFLGMGDRPGEWLEDPLVSRALLRRLAEQGEAGAGGAKSAAEALARLSHEFKTPLVSIKGYAELILDHEGQTLTPRLRDWVRRIAGGANRLAALYRKATAQARSEMSDFYEARPVDPAEWVRRCTAEVETLAAHRRLEWSHHCAGDLPYVRVDPEAAHEMLVELLQNAARATPDGGRVEVMARNETRPEGRGVRVTVSDTGIGVPRGGASLQLFERFATLGNLMGHHSGEFEYGAAGLGLGLTMARGVARSHGGDLWVEARGRDEKRLPGASFHVWLPAHEEGRRAPGPESADGPAGRMLLVEPDAELRDILTASLHSHYEVVGVGSAAEAVDRWADDEWQGCILEPRIPSGGVKLIRTLRAEPGREQAVILTYSTDADHSEMAAWRAAGADSCVGKPARTRVLLQRLRTVRERKTLR